MESFGECKAVNNVSNVHNTHIVSLVFDGFTVYRLNPLSKTHGIDLVKDTTLEHH